MNKCMRCDHELIISGNSMLSDYMDAQTEEEDAIVTYMFCPFCGASYEVADTPLSEQSKYPYWNPDKIDINDKSKS